jgi:hypothetical protein
MLTIKEMRMKNDPLGEACRHLANSQKIIEAKNAEIERLKLTDKEIEAIKWCLEQWTGIKRAETLHNLLERIKDK